MRRSKKNSKRKLRNCSKKLRGGLAKLPQGKFNEIVYTFDVTKTHNLFISLKRFDNNLQKISQPITPNKIITIQGIQFELQGCIQHMGDSLKGGHYIYEVFQNGNPHLIISDNVIYSVNNIDNRLLTQGYIYFYRRVGLLATNPQFPKLEGYCPLLNNNQRCYMNSAIQLLYSIPELRKIMNSLTYAAIQSFTNDNTDLNCDSSNLENNKIILRCLKLLFDTFNAQEGDPRPEIDTRAPPLVIDGVPIYDRLIQVTNLPANTQEDASEFLQRIFEAFECFNVPRLKAFYQLISYIPTRTYTCESGKKVTKSDPPLTIIACPIVQGQNTIQMLLNEYQKPEIPTEGNNMLDSCAQGEEVQVAQGVAQAAQGVAQAAQAAQADQVQAPPVQAPPAQAPPVQAPPVQALPIQAPPAQAPPAQAPPIQAPPVQAPPAQAPPAQAPPAQAPPAQAPPAQPAQAPPAQAPPAQGPPVQVPPAQEPPSGDKYLVTVTLGNQSFNYSMSSEASVRREEYFANPNGPAKLVQNELEVLRALGIDTKALQVAPLRQYLARFFDKLPDCQSDTSLVLAKDCEVVHFVLWYTMFANRQNVEERLRENNNLYKPYADISAALDQSIIDRLDGENPSPDLVKTYKNAQKASPDEPSQDDNDKIIIQLFTLIVAS